MRHGANREFFEGLFGGSKTPFNLDSSAAHCEKLLKKIERK